MPFQTVLLRRRPRRVGPMSRSSTYESRAVAKHRAQPEGSMVEHAAQVVVGIAIALYRRTHSGILRMAVHRNPVWLAFSGTLTVVGLICNSFGVSLALMDYAHTQAVNYLLIGCGCWVLTGAIIAYFSGKPLPGERPHR